MKKLAYREFHQLVLSRNFATTVGVLVVVAVFGLAIGAVMFVQNGESLRDVTVLKYL